MDLLTRFASNVRRLRSKKKLSQKALAGVLQRRAELLDVVSAKLKANGETETYLRP